MNLKNKKILLLLSFLMFSAIIIPVAVFNTEKLKNIGFALPILGLFFINLPIYLETLLPSYKEVNNYKIISACFGYLGRGLIIFAILRILYKIYA